MTRVCLDEPLEAKFMIDGRAPVAVIVSPSKAKVITIPAAGVTGDWRIKIIPVSEEEMKSIETVPDVVTSLLASATGEKDVELAAVSVLAAAIDIYIRYRDVLTTIPEGLLRDVIDYIVMKEAAVNVLVQDAADRLGLPWQLAMLEGKEVAKMPFTEFQKSKSRFASLLVLKNVSSVVGELVKSRWEPSEFVGNDPLVRQLYGTLVERLRIAAADRVASTGRRQERTGLRETSTQRNQLRETRLEEE